VKFKTVFILFNGIILIFLILLILFPRLVLPPGAVLNFRRSLWPIALVFFLILAGMDVFFITNYRLYALLDREDWPALARYLETQVMEKGRYFSLQVRLLANTYLLLSDPASATALENRLSLVRPKLLEEHALVFGLARILAKDYQGASRFLEARLAAAGLNKKQRPASWLSWYHGFALFLTGNHEKAAEIFPELVRFSGEPLLTGLAVWFLAEKLGKTFPEGKFTEAVDEGRKRVRERIPNRARWEKELAKAQHEVHAVMVMGYLRDTADWLYT
jgi:tetratricopeptide (TPR) repeat protein